MGVGAVMQVDGGLDYRLVFITAMSVTYLGAAQIYSYIEDLSF